MTRDLAHREAEDRDENDPRLQTAWERRNALTDTLDADTFLAFENELLRGISDGLDENAAWRRAWERVVGPIPEADEALPPRERTVRAQSREARERFRE